MATNFTHTILNPLSCTGTQLIVDKVMIEHSLHFVLICDIHTARFKSDCSLAAVCPCTLFRVRCSPHSEGCELCNTVTVTVTVTLRLYVAFLFLCNINLSYFSLLSSDLLNMPYYAQRISTKNEYLPLFLESFPYLEPLRFKVIFGFVCATFFKKYLGTSKYGCQLENVFLISKPHTVVQSH